MENGSSDWQSGQCEALLRPVPCGLTRAKQYHCQDRRLLGANDQEPFPYELHVCLWKDSVNFKTATSYTNAVF